jgi:methionyl aminopeptidase
MEYSRKQQILNSDDIKKMKKAGQLGSRTLDYITPHIKAGIKTIEIDKLVDDFMRSHGAVAATINYNGYKWASCTSINDVICHGFPDQTVLKEGDIINVDVTALVEGYHGDTSRTYYVGKVSDNARKVTECAQQAMQKGIEAITPNGHTGDIGFEINKLVTRHGFSAVKEIGGHGIGRGFHLDPFVPSFGKKGRGDILIPFTCITVEPMINETESELVEYDIPGSTIKAYRTSDGKLSAQFEHTVLITDTGYEILTVS